MKNSKKSIIFLVSIVLLSFFIVGISKFIFDSGFINDRLNKNVQYYEGKVKRITKEMLEGDKYIEGIELGYQNIVIEILEGPEKGKEYEIVNNISRVYNMPVKEDTKVILGFFYEGEEIKDIAVYSYKRSNIIFLLGLLFVIVIIGVGGFKGVKSLVSLFFTCVCIIFLMIPLMLRGVNPIAAAIFSSFISIVVTLTLVSGVNKKTFTAILGTLIGIIISGGIAISFGNIAKLSGISMAEAESMMYIAENTSLNIHGIMFAAILIASLGAVMDVAMSISSSIFEINQVNSGLTKKGLFKSGMNIGKDIIGTMANTLILAFAGGSLNTIIMLYASNMSKNQMLNLDVLCIEIIQGLSGSIGIILTVPITAFIASYLCNLNLKKSVKSLS
ncbi:YibE/F family protein [Clostridium sp. LIBA-8841]|uniref:YibE/F family protein n=1 Tax=Clostridium sp. LIBA-8841 TaxID=2987530 RepID=UPI002AC63A7E|nr:YibE/F family protein [Clostridium sp. LIBA-8841]MDZ5252259.1 YibE/F family protein [Clostridium sp. LIBA-8841]